MKVLVTGTAGFIASHIACALVDEGVEVVGIDDLSTGNYDNIDAIRSRPNGELFSWHKASVQESIDCIMRSCQGITHICHQAALGSIPRSLVDPDATFMANVMSFHCVMEAARKNKLKVVYASSSSVYGSPNSPYALSKKINEDMAAMYARAFGVMAIGLRYFNVFGPRQDPNSQYAAVIPRWIKQIRSGEAITMHGDGSQSRDFTYIDNVVTANLLALSAEFSFPVVSDVGCGVSTTIADVAYSLSLMLEQPLKIFHLPRRRGDADRSCAVSGPNDWYLDFTRTHLKEGLVETIKAYA